MASIETPQLETPTTATLRRPALALLVTYLLLLPAFVVPLVDSTQPPYFDLTSQVATLLCWIANTGTVLGAIVLATGLGSLLVTRPNMTTRSRWREVIVITLVIVACAGGGAAFNEHVIKPAFAVPRPNLAFLADSLADIPDIVADTPANTKRDHAEGNADESILGMSTKAFYALGDKEARRGPLRAVLEAEPPPVALNETIREHWILETGYSFPSGHAYFAMLFATFYLMMGTATTTETSAKRGWLFYLLLPWALMVCYSRTMLRVHTPGDIAVAGLLGMAMGMAGFVVAWKVIGRWRR